MPADERIHTGISSSRNYGIDLLRLVSMFMITTLHVLGQGGVMGKLATNHPTYYACWLLEAACLCAVNCFGLVSGYVGLYARFKWKRIITMMLTVEFYSLLLLVVLGFRHPDWLGRDVYLQCILPVQWKTWWYYSAYVCLCFLAPFINRGVQVLTAEEKKRLMLVIVCVFCVSTLFSKPFSQDFLELVGGYSLIWLVVLYVFGACLRGCVDEGMALPRRLWCLAGFAACVLAGWGWKLIVEYKVIPFPEDASFNRMLLTYTAPTIFGCGVFLVMLFGQISIRSAGARAVIGLLSPSAFFVYILHTHPLVWEHVLADRFARWMTLPPAGAIVRTLCASFVIFAVCLLVDVLRRQLTHLITHSGMGGKAGAIARQTDVRPHRVSEEDRAENRIADPKAGRKRAGRKTGKEEQKDDLKDDRKDDRKDN